MRLDATSEGILTPVVAGGDEKAGAPAAAISARLPSGTAAAIVASSPILSSDVAPAVALSVTPPVPVTTAAPASAGPKPPLASLTPT